MLRIFRVKSLFRAVYVSTSLYGLLYIYRRESDNSLTLLQVRTFWFGCGWFQTIFFSKCSYVYWWLSHFTWHWTFQCFYFIFVGMNLSQFLIVISDYRTVLFKMPCFGQCHHHFNTIIEPRHDKTCLRGLRLVSFKPTCSASEAS